MTRPSSSEADGGERESIVVLEGCRRSSESGHIRNSSTGAETDGSRESDLVPYSFENRELGLDDQSKDIEVVENSEKNDDNRSGQISTPGLAVKMQTQLRSSIVLLLAFVTAI